MLSFSKTKIAVMGLGYVGLPLAVAFSRKYSVIGYDINNSRIQDLTDCVDSTLEVSKDELKSSKNLLFTSNINILKDANVFIVTVPTPIDEHNRPNLSPLIKASEMIGKILKQNDVVIYESTVYPGATEEVCIPILEKFSGFLLNKNFFAGYSPERINPGDKEHKINDILKVTSGSNPEIAEYIDNLYSSIISAGTFKASSIKVAEAAKVIENTQRDVNIALINELSIIFNKLDIDTSEVLEAAGTKWNFLPFRPGLVGGHCIGVDPYYLTHKAQSIGHHPEIILAGRRINDGMSEYIVSQLIKAMLKKGIAVHGAEVLIMGLTFKENCPDLRNTKVADIVKNLMEYKINVDVVDPWCSNEESISEYNIEVKKEGVKGKYDAIVLAVNHKEFALLGADEIHALGKKVHLIYDLKYVINKSDSDMRL